MCFALRTSFRSSRTSSAVADEGQRDVIHAEFKPELDVGDVLFRHGGEADLDAGQIDVAAAAQFAVGEDLALDLVAGLVEDLHLDGAVVHEHDVADVDVVDELGIIDIHGIDPPRSWRRGR